MGNNFLDNQPLEIRIQTGKLGIGQNWRHKAMKWYFQSVFSGSPCFLVGIRQQMKSFVTEFKKFSADKLRTEAEHEENKWWNRKQCFGFVNALLQ